MNPEVIEISSFDLNDKSPSLKSSNFGGGLELLMNDKVKDGSGKSRNDIGLEDITALENELNDLTDSGPSLSFGGGSTSDLFSSTLDSKPSVRFDDSASASASASSSTMNEDNTKTWDGFGKFNNIPLNPDQKSESGSNVPQMSKEDICLLYTSDAADEA